MYATNNSIKIEARSPTKIDALILIESVLQYAGAAVKIEAFIFGGYPKQWISSPATTFKERLMDDDIKTPVIASIAELAETVDAWLVDIWGVMHNGVSPFPSSVAACQTFRQRGGYVLLLTNAPRPATVVMEQLDYIGVPRTAYDTVVTSGDVTRSVVKAWQGRRAHHIGPQRDLGIFKDLDISFTTPLDAEVVVCTGLVDDERETPEDYIKMLDGFQSRGIVMLCANPDLKVERGDKIVYCAGAIAQAYESMGGEVIYSGKPYLPAYELALGTLNNALQRDIPKERILAIGDGVLTDIKGAAAAGIRSVYIASGVHLERGRPLSSETIAELFAMFETGKPIAAMPAFAW